HGREAEAYLFFFSSRRRHTRFSRDWSSDVCSSDLYRNLYKWSPVYKDGKNPTRQEMTALYLNGERYDAPTHFSEELANTPKPLRSEERRVGKDRKTQRWREYQKKQQYAKSVIEIGR